MLYYALGAFAISLFNLLIFLLSFRSRYLASSKIRAYFQWSFFVSCWSLGYGITLSGLFDYSTTFFFNKLCQAMATMIGPFFFKLSTCLSDDYPKKAKVYIFYLWTGAVIATLLLLTDWFVKGLWSFHSFKYQPLGGPLYGVFVGFFIWCNLHAFLVVFKKYISLSGKKKKQMGLFLVATGIGYGLGAELFLQGFGLAIDPHGIFFMFLYVVLLGYAIQRYQFLDMEELVKNTLVFAGIFGAMMAVVGVITVIAQSYLGQFFGMGRMATQILSILIAIALFDPTRKLLINLTDKFLFQKKYDYHKLLKDASRGMSNIESLERLLGLVVHFITMKMRVKNAAVLMREGTSDQYHLVYQRGFDKRFLTLTLYENDPLIHYLESHKEAVDIERIKEQVEASSYRRDKSEKAYDYEAIRERMHQLQASCCVPSFLGRELRNVLMLGEKKSGEYYSNEDLNLLYTLAQESSIAIENARLYDEALRKSHELEHINEQLEYSKELLMKALQEAEGANKQLQDTQAQLIHEQKMATLGRLAASVGHEVNNPLTILSMNVSRVILKHRKNKDMKVTEILDVFDKMEKNIERIKAVVNTLTGLLKKSEKGKFEPLSLKLILEETLPLVQFQTYLDNLSGTEVDFNVPGNVPLIRGDLERLQEVFLNLFINAYHAMAGKRHRKIGVQAEIDPKDPNMVAIHFRDNGSGMTEDIMKKVFNYGFTTKAPGKGSGLGLYMCKYIIELHGGTITVASKLGEGTTFTLTLPIYSEAPALKQA
jgi:signal transduction histidine kinase